MRVPHLPQDILPNKTDKLPSIAFRDHYVTHAMQRGKSVLTHNAISLVVSGEKSIQFADATLPIKEDDFYFLSSGNCLASVKLGDNAVFRSIMIFFDNKVLADFYVKYADRIKTIRDKDSVPPATNVYFKKDAFVYHYMKSLILLLENPALISEEMKLLKLEELLVYLLDKEPRKLLSFKSAQPKELNDLEMRQAVEANISYPTSLDDLAFLCNLSLSTFKRRFQSIYGTSPGKWFLQKRMEMAKNLLQHHQEKPSEVYYKVGYENHSSFAQSFRQTFGMTPSEFQSQHLNTFR